MNRLAILGIALVPLMVLAQKGQKVQLGPDLNISEARRIAIIQADRRKNIDDAAALLKLAEKLKFDLDNEDPQVNSVTDLKIADDIQRLAKNISGRVKHN